MCLTVHTSEHPDLKPKVAGEDIKCFKVVRWMDPTFLEKMHGATSVPTGLYESDYVYGRTNVATEFEEQIEDAEHIGSREVRRGFHSFKNFSDTVRELDFWLRTCSKYHSDHHFEIVECLIPAGTEYYEGYDGSLKPGYVSRTLVVEDFEEGEGYYKKSSDIEKRYK